MANVSFTDEFLDYNIELLDHKESASTNDTSNDKDGLFGTQNIDYRPLEHVHENCNNCR